MAATVLLKLQLRMLPGSQIKPCDRNKAHGIQLPRIDSLLPDQRHPVLNPVDAVRNFGEVPHAHALLLASERAVVGGRQIQLTAEKRKLERLKIPRNTKPEGPSMSLGYSHHCSGEA
jgi:hypothetical protein